MLCSLSGDRIVVPVGSDPFHNGALAYWYHYPSGNAHFLIFFFLFVVYYCFFFVVFLVYSYLFLDAVFWRSDIMMVLDLWLSFSGFSLVLIVVVF